MVVRQDRRDNGAGVNRAAFAAVAGLVWASAVLAGPRWCLGMGGLGPIRAGMTAEQVMRLADFPGMERKKPAGECWYLRYHGGGTDFDLMIIQDKVVRLELNGASTLGTFAGARIGSSEDDLKALYGARLDIQPHKYDEHGHTITMKSSGGDYGLRFETSSGKVTAIQAGPWQHLNYVEGCG
jgi:hypothetical protein